MRNRNHNLNHDHYQVLIVNKPIGWTSNDVVQKVKRLLGGVKVGHAGTLDPLAEGVLILLAGRATKDQQKFTKLQKEYLAEVTFGQVLDTYDGEGRILEQAPESRLKNLTEEDVKKTLVHFRGKIKQRVPPFSAVWVNGKRLYKLARKGLIKEEDLPERDVSIDSLELVKFSPYCEDSLPRAELKIACSSGTYVRSLAHDLGRLLNVGGFVSRIVRTRVGDFNIKDAQRIEDIKEKKTVVANP